MKELQGKVALVTGGTRGIGRSIALALADAGADVLFSYQHSSQQAEEVCQAIREKGVRSKGYQADVASAEAVQVHAEDFIPHQFRHLQEGFVSVNACIIDQNGNGPELSQS